MKGSVRESILMAMKSLASSRQIDRISVEEICREAGCSRPTFYKYFPDKYAACYAVYRFSSAELLDDYSETLDLKTMMTLALEIIRKDWPFYRSVIRDAYTQNSFFSQYIEHGMETNAALIGKAQLTPDLKKILYGYTVGGAHIILRWMEEGIREDPEEIASILCRLVPEELRAYLIR